MENNDGHGDRHMVFHVLESFAFHRHVERLSPMAAYNAVREDEELGDIVQPMLARAMK